MLVQVTFAREATSTGAYEICRLGYSGAPVYVDPLSVESEVVCSGRDVVAVGARVVLDGVAIPWSG